MKKQSTKLNKFFSRHTQITRFYAFLNRLYFRCAFEIWNSILKIIKLSAFHRDEASETRGADGFNKACVSVARVRRWPERCSESGTSRLASETDINQAINSCLLNINWLLSSHYRSASQILTLWTCANRKAFLFAHASSSASNLENPGFV